MATEPPAPSPAPTLDQHFPGYYPPTPSVMEDERTLPTGAPASASATTTTTTTAIQPETSASSASAQTSTATDEQPHETTNQERLIGAGKALLGAAAGFVVGGTVGAAAGASLVGMTQVEQQGVDEQLHHSKDGEAAATAATPTGSAHETLGSEAKVPNLDSHAAFGTPAVEKEQAELEHSPAQQLLAQADNSSHDKQKGEALLLAGGAGAHNAEHEVEVPGTETNVNDSEPPTPKASSTALMPDFGTPAVEKERSELEHSPAQRLLAEAASSSSTATPPLSAEAALLGAAAAGATAVGKPENEVEEPSTKPVDEAVVDDLKAGGGIPTHEAGQTGETVTATPLGDETASTERPSLPTPSGSLESFSGAVLAAGSGVETPSVAPGPTVSGFGDRGSELIYLSDRDIEGNGAKESPEQGEKEGETASLPIDTPGARSDVSFPVSDQTEKPQEERVLDTGLSIPPAGFVLADENAPKDFEPYTPPALPESSSAAADDEDDDTPHPTAAEKGKGRAFDMDETLAVAAAAGGGGFATAVGMKSFEREKTEEPTSAPTSTFTENLDTPSISATPKDPLWDQRADLPPTAQVTQHEPHRALDPQALVSEAAPATSPEQAGFTGVATGAEPTPAMQDFAHLSQPAPNAEEAAMRTDTTTEQDESRRSEMVPVAAAAGMAGIGAGAASTRLLAREPAPMATPPRAAGGPASLSRFTEDTTRTGSPLEMGSTPSSTQAVMGSPAPNLPQGSPTPMVPDRQSSDVVPGSVVPQRFQQGAPAQHVQVQPVETSNIERSPHMKIATNVVDGHKRLHRKSLSKGTSNSARSSGESGEFERPGPGAPAAFMPIQQPPVQALPAQRAQQPVMMPQQAQQPVMVQQQQPLAPQPQSRFVPTQQPQPQVIPSNAAASGPTGAAGARPHIPAADQEARRDRMMDSIVGVRDPIVTGPPVGATIPAGAPAVTARILPSHEASLFPPAGPTRTESDASALGQRHNETHQGVPPMALGITAVTAAVIPGMATLPPVGGLPVPQQRQQPPPQQPQQQQMPVGGPGMVPPSTMASTRTDNAGVQRKLSKKQPHEPVEKERKEGFFSKIFGGGSGRHSRDSSQNSRNGVPVSPRNSSDLRRE